MHAAEMNPLTFVLFRAHSSDFISHECQEQQVVMLHTHSCARAYG